MALTTFVLILYLSIIALITLFSYRKVKNYHDFFNARKQGNTLTITGSLIATILGGSAIIGAVNEGPKLGWATSWYMLSAAIGLFALLPIAGKINKTGRFTLPGLLGDLYTPGVRRISSWIIATAWLGVIAAQMIAAARILESFTGMSYTYGVLCSGLVFIVYTLAGGQLSVLKTDFFQSILIILGLAVMVVFSSKLKLPETGTLIPQFPFNANFSPLDLVVLLFTYATTFTFGPDIYSRIFCAGSEKVARRAVSIAATILIPVALSIGFISVVGSFYLPFSGSGSIFIDVSKAILPEWAVALIVVSLLSAVLSSADTTILTTSIILTELYERNSFGNKTLSHSRFFIVLAGIISTVIALNFTSIIGILITALTVYSGAFIIPLIAGLWNININRNNLVMAMLCGGICALTGKIVFYTGAQIAGNIIIIASFLLNASLLFAGKKISPKNND